MLRRINVDIIGAINDHKLKARVTGEIEDETGEGRLEFRYDEVPLHWHPLNYTDPLVLLPGYRNATGTAAFRSLQAPGSFTAECTFDFGNGFLLRKGASIIVEGNNHTGGYYITGTVRAGNIFDALGEQHQRPYEYREYLHPGGPGQIIGVGHARWPHRRRDGDPIDEPIEAVVSARYRLVGWTRELPGHYVRVLAIPEATWDAAQRIVRATFRTHVERLVS
jgi:hypothetical protein